MSHVIEPATSGRAKCRGCEQKITKGEIRFGEVTENPFGDGDRTLWFHPVCGAYKRPEPLLEAIASTDADLETAVTPADAGGAADWLTGQSRLGVEFRRLPRISGAGRAPTGRARCRSCREPIAKDAWRIALVFYEEGYFNPSGFIHACCWREYFEAPDLDAAIVRDRLAHFSPELEGTEISELHGELKTT